MMSVRFALVSFLTTAACVAADSPTGDELPELPLGGKSDGVYAFYGVGSTCGGGDCGFELQTLNANVAAQVDGVEWPQLGPDAEEAVASNLFGQRVVILASAVEREDGGASTSWVKAYRVWVAVNGGFTPGTPSYTWLTRKREFCAQEPCVTRFDQYVLNGPQLDPVTEVSMNSISDPTVVAQLEQLLTSGEGILVLGQAQGTRFVVSRAYVPR